MVIVTKELCSFEQLIIYIYIDIDIEIDIYIYICSSLDQVERKSDITII